MHKKYIIVGKNGQLASAFCKLLDKDYIAFSHTDHDFCTYDNIVSAFNDIDAKIIINCSAYTNVDKAEDDVNEAHKANEVIPHMLAKYCKNNNITFVHYSTDYVFDGTKVGAYTEDDNPSPINIYGKSKLAGEQAIINIGGNYLIFRTSWVYNATHKNFLTTMLKLAKERQELSIVSDQIGAPSYTFDIAKKTLEALTNINKMDSFPSGIYHLCNSGATNWHEYANLIFNVAKNCNFDLKIDKVNAISTSQYPTPAKRPLNSRLDCSKAKYHLNIQMPKWQDSVKNSIETKNEDI